MGGAVGFTIRERNGTEHRMCRWTNNFSWYTDNMRLVNKNPAHLKRYLAGWDELKKTHREEPNKWFASCLVPYAGLNPVEYGLIVVDYRTNTILDMNDYHHTCAMNVINISVELQERNGRRINYDTVDTFMENAHPEAE
jgi:hypothetical protein